MTNLQAGSRPEAASACELVGRAWRIWFVRDELDQGTRALATALNAPDVESAGIWRVRALYADGVFAFRDVDLPALASFHFANFRREPEPLIEQRHQLMIELVDLFANGAEGIHGQFCPAALSLVGADPGVAPAPSSSTSCATSGTS